MLTFKNEMNIECSILNKLKNSEGIEEISDLINFFIIH